MTSKKRPPARITTTIGELAAAFYDSALTELKNPLLAARVAEHMVLDVLARSSGARVALT